MIVARLILIALTLVICSYFVFLLLTVKKYDEMIEPLADEEFQLKSIYVVGFTIIDKFHLDFRSRSVNALREKAKILYGEKFVEYYIRVIYAQKISFAYFAMVLVCILSCFASGSDGLVLFAIGLVLAGVVYYYFGTRVESQLKKKSIQYLSEFPDAISTIALLVNSGMVLREAWSEVAYSDDKPLHMQMRQVTEDMNNGMSEGDALYAFGLRCATPEIKKFTSLIIQGLEKGSRDLAVSLRNQSAELWEMKRQNVLQQGQLASSKLLIPIFVMFIGILIMVMGPIMTNLGL